MADTVAITLLEFAKNQRRADRQQAQHQERLVPPIICAPSKWKRSGIKMAVTSEAAATPKLIDICCMVLAMELALLELIGHPAAEGG